MQVEVSLVPTYPGHSSRLVDLDADGRNAARVTFAQVPRSAGPAVVTGLVARLPDGRLVDGDLLVPLRLTAGAWPCFMPGHLQVMTR